MPAGERKRKEAGVLDPAKEKSEGRLSKKRGDVFDCSKPAGRKERSGRMPSQPPEKSDRVPSRLTIKKR